MRRSHKSVLLKQAPQKRRESTSKKKFVWMGAAALFATIAISAISFSPKTVEKTAVKRPQLDIEFNIETREKISGDLIKSLNFHIQKWWQTDSKLTLKGLAEKTQKQFSFERVHFLQVGPEHVIISVALRSPIMLIDATPPRYVSESGAVYGFADRANHPKLPYLVGIFEVSPKGLAMKRDGTVRLSHEEFGNITTAIEVLDEARRSGHTVAQIKFEKFRGYELTLEPDGLEVFLGFKNYRKKFARLKKLTLNLQKSGSQAARIELDYNDKAFVKRKM